MPDFLLSNFGSAVLTEPLAVGELVMKISQSKSARFPQPEEGEAFAVILWDGREETSQEIVYCTNNPLTGELTISRGEENTTEQAWLAGTQVRHALTAESVQSVLQSGFVDGSLANQEEAEEGTDNSTLMSPLRTQQWWEVRSTAVTREMLAKEDVESLRAFLGFITVTLSGTGLEDTFLIDTDAEYDPDYTKVYEDEVFLPTGYSFTGPDGDGKYSIVFDTPPAAGTDNITLVLGVNFAFSVSFPGDNTVGTSAIIDLAVTTAKLAAGAVTTAKLADGAVTGAKLAAGSVSGTVLQDNSVSGTKLAANSVGSTALQDLAVTTAKLNNLAVTESKLAASAVTNTKLADLSVSTGKLQDGSVTEAKLASSSVTVNKIGTGAVTEAKIGTGAVTNAKLGSAAVTLAKMASNSVGSSQLVDGSVTNTKLGSGSVSLAKMASNSVGTSQLVDNSVTDAKLGSASSIRTYLDVVAMSASAGAVGTYAFCSRQDNPRQTDFGQTRAGSSLYPTNSDDAPSAFGPSQSGTWRCMGYTTEGTGDQSITLWRRES